MYKHILVPLDGSEASLRGLNEAIGLAHEQQARLRLLHVVTDFPLMIEMSAVTAFSQTRDELVRIGEGLLQAAKKAAAERGVDAQAELRESFNVRAADLIVDEAKAARCDLIVMGTHGRRGLSRAMLGSDAESVARMSPVPVLLVGPGQ